MPIIKLVARVESPTFFEDRQDVIEILYPSTVVKEYFQESEKMEARVFIDRAMKAMAHANELVKEKYGYGCFSCTYYSRQLTRILERQDVDSLFVRVTDLLG